jgi:hypothetical protein
MPRPAGCNSDGAARARVGVPTRSGRTDMVGTGRVWRLIPSWRWRWHHVVAPAVSRRRKVGAGRVGSHGPSAQAAFSEPGRPPYDARGRDSLILSHATGSDFSGSQFVSGRTPSNITGRETDLYGWIDGYLRRICNRDCQRWVLETPMRPAQPRAVRETVEMVSLCCDLLAPWLWLTQRP